MRKLRIAAVGVGPCRGCRSERHMEVIQKLSDMYELCALCDKDERRLREAGETFGVKALYTGLDDMLRQEKPDVAYRLTPKDSMTPINVRIAESKVHLLTEIPIGLTLPTADVVIKACHRNNVKMEIAENVWVWPEPVPEDLRLRESSVSLFSSEPNSSFLQACNPRWESGF